MDGFEGSTRCGRPFDSSLDEADVFDLVALQCVAASVQFNEFII